MEKSCENGRDLSTLYAPSDFIITTDLALRLSLPSAVTTSDLSCGIPTSCGCSSIVSYQCRVRQTRTMAWRGWYRVYRSWIRVNVRRCVFMQYSILNLKKEWRSGRCTRSYYVIWKLHGSTQQSWEAKKWFSSRPCYDHGHNYSTRAWVHSCNSLKNSFPSFLPLFRFFVFLSCALGVWGSLSGSLAPNHPT